MLFHTLATVRGVTRWTERNPKLVVRSKRSCLHPARLSAHPSLLLGVGPCTVVKGEGSFEDHPWTTDTINVNEKTKNRRLNTVRSVPREPCPVHPSIVPYHSTSPSDPSFPRTTNQPRSTMNVTTSVDNPQESLSQEVGRDSRRTGPESESSGLTRHPSLELE